MMQVYSNRNEGPYWKKKVEMHFNDLFSNETDRKYDDLGIYGKNNNCKHLYFYKIFYTIELIL